MRRGLRARPGRPRLAALLWLGGLLVAGCAHEGHAGAARVFAAASIAPVVEEVLRAAGDDAVVVAAASSTLAKQIEAGAAAAVFVSANPEWLDYLAARGRVVTGGRAALVGNRLVFVAARGSAAAGVRIEPRRGMDLASAIPGRLALGDPSHVPAGRYAVHALQRLGLWQQVRDSIAAAADVRAALRLVERGECDVGIVYETDARASDAVTVVGEFPPGAAPTVRYELAIVAPPHPRGEALSRLLRGPAARDAYASRGFSVPD